MVVRAPLALVLSALAALALAGACRRETGGSETLPDARVGKERISATAAAHLERTLDELERTLEGNYVYGPLRRIDWASLGDRYRKQLDSIREMVQFAGLAKALVAEIGDPDVVWQSREERIAAELEYSTRYEGIGTYIAFRGFPVPRVIILDVIPGSPAEGAGIQAHDSILSIDGAPVRPGEGTTVAQRIRGPGGTKVRLIVRRPGARDRELAVTRARVDLSTVVYHVRSGFVAGTGVGYVQLPRSADANVAQEVAQALDSLGQQRRLAGLLLDLRISGTGAFPLEELLTLFGNGRLGATYTAEAAGDLVIEGQDYARSQSLPLAVLVGPDTEGAAEILAAALQAAGRALVVGSRTPGSVERDQQYGLVDGSRLWLPVWSYRAGDGTEIGIDGVRPDVEAGADWDAVSDASDAVREAAARAIEKGRRP